MAGLFDWSNRTDQSTRNTQLGGLGPGEQGLRDTGIGTGMGQGNFYTAELAKMFNDQFGGKGAPAPGGTNFGAIAPRIGDTFLNSPEFANRSAGFAAPTVAGFAAAHPSAGQADIAQAYQAFLGRAASPDEVNAWAATHNSAPDIYGMIAGSPEGLAHPATGHPDALIGSIYQNILGRPARPDEIQAWASTGKSPQEVAQGILNSPEAQQRMGGQTAEQGITELYQGLLGRAPTPEELAHQYTAAGLPGEGEGGAAVDPRQKLFDQATQSLMDRLSGKSPLVSPEMEKQINDVFAHQQTKGLEDLDRQFRTGAQERGLDEGLGTTVGNIRARGEGEFMGNIASQRAAAMQNAGQQEFQNLGNILTFGQNIAANADRNRLSMLTGAPGAADFLNSLLSNERIAGSRTNTSGTTGNVGTSIGADTVGNVGQFLTGAGGLAGPLGNLGSWISNLFSNNGGLSGGSMFGDVGSGIPDSIFDEGFSF